MAHKAKWDRISSMVNSSLRGSPICSRHSSQRHHWQGHSLQGLCSPSWPMQVPQSLIFMLPALPEASCEEDNGIIYVSHLSGPLLGWTTRPSGLSWYAFVSRVSALTSVSSPGKGLQMLQTTARHLCDAISCAAEQTHAREC